MGSDMDCFITKEPLEVEETTVWKPKVLDPALFDGIDAKYKCTVTKLAENKHRVEVKFTKTLIGRGKNGKGEGSDKMRTDIANALTANGMTTVASMVVQEMTVPISLLSKQTRRRLGWKPSHDISHRHDGFHPLINR